LPSLLSCLSHSLSLGPSEPNPLHLTLCFRACYAEASKDGRLHHDPPPITRREQCHTTPLGAVSSAASQSPLGGPGAKRNF
jgi:hypothetical protein